MQVSDDEGQTSDQTGKPREFSGAPDLPLCLVGLIDPEIKAGSLEELALAHAEILGWLQGLFQGTQLAMQLETARAFEQHLRQQLPVQGEPAAGKVEPKPADSQYL